MFARILATLMWRHWLARKRQFICTLLELVFPLLFLGLIFAIRLELDKPLDSEVMVRPGPLSLRSTLGPPVVLYTPKTVFTRKLMSRVGNKLHLQEFYTLPGKRSNETRGRFGFNDPVTVLKYTENMGPDEAVVVFHNMPKHDTPKSLNYSIRMKTPFKTHKPIVVSNEKGIMHLIPHYPHTQYGIDCEAFMRLQWAIDQSFIELLTGKEVKQSVIIHEIPRGRRSNNQNLVDMKVIKASFIFFAIYVGLIPSFYVFMGRLIVEKATGVQELMKIAGVSTKALLMSHILNALFPGLVFSIGGTVLMKFGPSALLEKTPGLFVFLFFLLYFLLIISSGMAFSYIGCVVRSPVYALIAYFILTTPVLFTFGKVLDKVALYICGVLIPFTPIIWILFEVTHLEGESGLSFSNMVDAHTPYSGSALLGFIIQIIHIALFFLISWYLEQVTGSYALPWNFLCQKAYWRKASVDPMDELETEAVRIQEPQYFEPPPSNLESGIKIVNVTKMYGPNRAVDDLSLEVYKGEITILLGHNGAGKSTLMSIITGVLKPTKGQVLVNGYNIESQALEARQHIGMCPQQNLFLDGVSVIEHVMFFTLLKKGTYREARISAEKLLEKLNLQQKANSQSPDLSGGMKRRLQLACALAGQANVLILDEPTSGLDVETRRSLWDIFVSLRGSHTVLLSTHFMEEADALGDRVAALHAGQLRCHATPMYLKRAIGTGYRLTFTTTGSPKEAAITSVVQSVVPEATATASGFNSISYKIPMASTKSLPGLFSKLESKKTELGVESMGVGVSTLEEVFLKLCSGYDGSPLTDVEEEEGPVYQKQTGAALYSRQFLVLIKRYFRFLWVYKYSQILFGTFFMFLLILTTTFGYNNTATPKTNKTFLAVNLDIYRPLLNHRILYKVNNDSRMRLLSDLYPRVTFENVSDLEEAVLRAGQKDTMKHNSYLAGIELNETDAKVLCTTEIRHTAPATLNLLSNMIATRALPQAEGRVVTTYNHPLTGAYIPFANEDFKMPKNNMALILWQKMIILYVLTGLCFLLILPCKEQDSGARLTHILAGCPPELHWAAMLFTALLHILLYVIVIVIACAFLDFDKTISDVKFILPASLVVLLGSVASLVYLYDFTLTSSERMTLVIAAILAVIGVFVIPLLCARWFKSPRIVLIFEIILPQFAFTQALADCTNTAYVNALCKLNKDKCPFTDVLSPHFKDGKCCESKSDPLCYFCLNNHAPGREILILIGQIFLFSANVMLRQRGVHSFLMDKILNIPLKAPPQQFDEKTVKAEEVYVKNTIVLPPKEITDMMLVSNVHKNYVDLCSNFYAVKGVSFSVKKGECFGLLGVNGAGKTSMFRMLTADRCVTKGQIFANGRFLTLPCFDKYLFSLSYCPQFWGLDDFLTGRQNLDLLLTLQGFNERDMNALTKTWIKLVDLEKYTDQLVSGYSGGCLRRLAAACALCTGAPLTLLDEPTAGVDVAARRRVWYALKRGLRDQHAIIITSHSLDEMEALCHRIAIMVAGQLCALGSPAALKAAFAVGHSVILKIKHETDESTGSQVDQLKAFMQQKFNCTLKDEHKTMLNYHINETMEYSRLFQDMEQVQSTFPSLIEDYSVSETTLEEVFLSFAKRQEEMTKAQGKNKATSEKEGKAETKNNAPDTKKNDEGGPV